MQGVVALVCLAAGAHLIAVNRAQLRGVFSVEPFDTAFHWMGGLCYVTTYSESSAYTRDSPMLRSLMNDCLFYYCYEPLQLFHTAQPGPSVVYTDGESRLAAVLRHSHPIGSTSR